MDYFDDIINVNAYLRAKMRNNAENATLLIRDAVSQSEKYDQMLNIVREYKSTACKVAKSMEIEVSDILNKQSTDMLTEKHPDCAELLIELPNGFNFDALFDQLCEEAHKAGYTNVHPEELLTADEMRSAQEFCDALDKRFERETHLTFEDMKILFLAVLTRVILYYSLRFLGNKFKDKGEEGFDQSTNHPTDIYKPFEPEAISTVSDKMHDNLYDFIETISEGYSQLKDNSSSNGIGGYIRDKDQIINEHIPFDLPDNEYFKHNEIAGFHAQLGWLIGVANILTNTVTTLKGTSYSVLPSLPNICQPTVGHEISTIAHVVDPVLKSITQNKEALVAAIIQEAGILKVRTSSIDKVYRILEKSCYTESKNATSLDAAKEFSILSAIDFNDVSKNTAITFFINYLVATIHAIHYDEISDGDITSYAIRTNKILTISGTIATIINSASTLVQLDLSNIDWGGLLTTCLTLLNSTRIWINAKYSYLVSEHKKEIDKLSKDIDKYFTSSHS